MKRVTINDLKRRLEITLSKDRSSLSKDDVELLEAIIQALEDLKILNGTLEKKKKVAEIGNYLFRFYANHGLLQKYQKVLEKVLKQLL